MNQQEERVVSKDQLSESGQSTAGTPPSDSMQELHIEVGAGDSGEDIVQRLKLPPVGGENYPKAVIVLIGTTSLSDDGPQHIPARLVQLFGRGLAKAVAGDHALVIDASKGDEAAAALSGAVFDASDNALLIKVGEGSQ